MLIDRDVVMTLSRFSSDGPPPPEGKYPFAASRQDVSLWLGGHGLSQSVEVIRELATRAAASTAGVAVAYWDNLVVRAYTDGTCSVANY